MNHDDSFFDPQVNGYAGIDFQRDDLTANDLRHALNAWRRDGGGRFLVTFITDTWTRLLARLRALGSLRQADPELRDGIVGWHVEGPFLSPKPGFCGAHDPALMLDPSPGHMRQLREIVPDDPLLVTVAPERTGALAAIETAAKLGIRVSLGHTDASSEQLRDAVAAGATGFTHLANGCPQQLDRHDNIVWRVLDNRHLVIGLIADSIHVSPSLFRLIHRVVPPERVYYTTDSMAAAGSPPGVFPLGRLRLEVGQDGIVRQPGQTNFAGSSLSPCQLRERTAAMLGADADHILPRTRDTAVRWLGLAS